MVANTKPDAVAPGTLAATQLYSMITVNDGPDGGDVNPVTGKGTGVVKLRCIGFDADGVAETCSLPFTRREAVARQNALKIFEGNDQYKAALAAACTALGTTDFGDSPADLAKDECDAKPKPPTGDPLPGT